MDVKYKILTIRSNLLSIAYSILDEFERIGVDQSEKNREGFKFVFKSNYGLIISYYNEPILEMAGEHLSLISETPLWKLVQTIDFLSHIKGRRR